MSKKRTIKYAIDFYAHAQLINTVTIYCITDKDAVDFGYMLWAYRTIFAPDCDEMCILRMVAHTLTEILKLES